jgi:CxxC motif-containing protein (DUF1111 family)
LLPPPEETGGALTTDASNWRFLELAEAVPLERIQRFSQGRELFTADWEVAPSGRPVIDGLGPLFNEVSCVGCHPSTGRPPTLGADGAVHPGLLLRLVRPDPAGTADAGAPAAASLADPVLGAQFQPRAVPGVPAEGVARWTDVADGERVSPRFDVEVDEAYGALHPDTHAVGRASPHLVGLGLLDLVADEVILEAADPDDSDGDGISGRVHRLDDGQIGRFGWKALQPSLRAQSAMAFSQDIGITTPDFPEESCTGAQQACLAGESGGAPEVDEEGMAALVEYQRYLGVPAARRDIDRERLENGARHFEQAGCATCHRPKLTTAELPEMPLLSEQTFYAFTDLLLHDMGPALADPVGEGDASGSEWRTPPLWGLGLVEELDPTARYLHDGRAATLHEAILWHGGEAEASRRYVETLESDDLQDLLAFLRSL